MEKASAPGTHEISLSAAIGAAAGIAGGLIFAGLHALLIVPIWNRMTSGLIWAALTGAAAGWAYRELYPLHRDGMGAQVWDGARFGGLLWIVVTPVTATDALLRALGWDIGELILVPLAVLIAVGGGAFLGWRRQHRIRAAVAAATATLILTIAMAGPVPIARSTRSLGIFLAVFPASVAGGALLGAFGFVLARRGAKAAAGPA